MLSKLRDHRFRRFLNIASAQDVQRKVSSILLLKSNLVGETLNYSSKSLVNLDRTSRDLPSTRPHEYRTCRVVQHKVTTGTCGSPQSFWRDRLSDVCVTTSVQPVGNCSYSHGCFVAFSVTAVTSDTSWPLASSPPLSTLRSLSSPYFFSSSFLLISLLSQSSNTSHFVLFLTLLKLVILLASLAHFYSR